MGGGAQSRSRDDAAELCIGLLFAAAKNPAIAAAQALVYALQAGGETVERARADAAALAASPTATTLGRCDGLRRITLETLQTAHAIGGVRTVLDADGFDLGGDGEGEAPLWAAPGETIALAHIAAHRDDAFVGRRAGDRRRVVPARAAREWDRVDGDGGGLSGWLRRTPDDYTFTTFSQGCTGARASAPPSSSSRACSLTCSDGPFRTTLRPPVPAPSFERATLAQRDGPVAAVMDSPGEFSADTT